MKKLFLDTVGCQMNVLDSELVVAGLRRQGYSLTDDPNDADVVLFNTCSIRELAEEKIYSALGKLKARKRLAPDIVIGVLGCMAQKDQEGIFKRAPHVDLVAGPGALEEIPELVEEIRRTRKPQMSLSLDRGDAGRREVERSFASFDPLRDSDARPTRFQAFVRTQFGCDKFCTYCIVPSVRGPEQGRDPDAIVREVELLATEGVVEVTLLGQTVNSYRYRHGDGRRVRFSDLLARVDAVPGIRRVKFVTSFPNDMTDDLLDAVRDLPNVAEYLHVPAQSGCDDVLSRMKRHYSVARYLEMVDRARERVPGVAISSDFIVGFCGETEESFQRSCDLVRRARFKNSFIFQYSARPGTEAFAFADDVPDEVKKRRNNELLAVQQDVSRLEHRALIGRTVEVLVEGPSRLSRTSAAGQLVGRSAGDHIVVFDGPASLAGTFVKVKIEDATALTLYGDVDGLDPAQLPPRAPIRPRAALPVL